MHWKQCAGNRRALFTHDSASTSTEGIPWEEGTIANISFGGCLLLPFISSLIGSEKTETLRKSGKKFHVIFESSQDCGEEEGGIFGGSVEGNVLLLVPFLLDSCSCSCMIDVPLVTSDPTAPIMLAWQQNSETLTLQHGAPLRVVVPGIIGARSVKWLRKITLSTKAVSEKETFLCFVESYKDSGPESDSSVFIHLFLRDEPFSTDTVSTPRPTARLQVDPYVTHLIQTFFRGKETSYERDRSYGLESATMCYRES